MSSSNLQYWKELVGLEDTDFPHLIEITEKNISKSAIVGTRMQEIENSIATNGLVDIQVHPGWGATTLFRVLKDRLNKEELTLLLDFDFEKNKLDGTMTADEFRFLTKWKLASRIVEAMREKPRQQNYMYEVLDFEDIGETPWVAHLRRKKRKLDDCSNNPELFYSEFPFFEKMAIADCVNYFLANFQIRSVFLYLLPKKVDEDGLLGLVGLIKSEYDGKDIQPAAMREVYICTSKIMKQIKEFYTRPYYDVLYKRYSAAEIYSMLVSVYRGDDERDFVSVNDVLDEEFINKSYSDKKDLKKIMSLVEKKMEEALAGDVASIPYKLMYSDTRGD